MGLDTRKPPLPAPTESSTLQTSGGSVTGTDLATDLSRRTDRTSYSIPEDGSPVTISTKKRRDRDRDQENILTRAHHQSQTSLLIEYFEGGKGPNVHSRPSVRVKVTPSAARKIKNANDHIQITEAGGHRKPSYTRRISLGPTATGDRQITESADDRSISSYTSAAEESSLAGRRPPVEIEVLPKGQGSDLSGASGPADQRYTQFHESEISSMPPDSMVEVNAENLTPRRNRSRSLSRDEVVATTNTLKTPSRRRSRSLSRERITQKAIEKIRSKPREVSSRGKHEYRSKSRSGSLSKEQLVETTKSPRRKSSRHHHEEELPSGAESSLLTNSQLSPRRRSGDQYSFRSGTSKSSINNPKLLETVEDAIRRLIMPELAALKQEQKTQHNRNKFELERGDSIQSGGSSSRGEITRRMSKHASAPDVSARPKVVLNRDDHHAGTILSGNSIKGRKNGREKVFDSPSERSFSRGLSEETVIRDEDDVSRRRDKSGHRLRDAAAGGIAGAILTTAALKHHDSKSSVDRRERRRKRSKSHSRSGSFAESTEEIFHKHDVPPMPMRSEINGSELTRDSILSERTEEPPSPVNERRRAEIREVSRGSPREVLSPASRTPTRTPLDIHKGFGTHHSNLSQGNLGVSTADSDRIVGGEDERLKFAEAGLAGGAAGATFLTANHLRNRHDENDERAYSHGVDSRGLSPIQSVASYREDSEIPNRESYLKTRSSDSLSSLGHHSPKHSGMSIDSLSSAASIQIARSNRPKGIHLEPGRDVLDQHELRNSETAREDFYQEDPAMEEWYDQQHQENERYRESFGDNSSKGPTVDFRHLTNYTDDSLDVPNLDKVTAAQQVRGMGANPEYVHTPVAVESAVASLLDTSVLEARSNQSARSKLGDQSISDSLDDVQDPFAGYPGSNRDVDFDEHESHPDQYHEKGYNGMLSAGKPYEQLSTGNSPRQSIARSLDEHEDHIHMGASGLPIANDPIPEIGHGLDSESDLNTNPSIIQGPIGGIHHDNRDHWPYEPTPPQSRGDLLSRSNDHSAHESLKAAAAGMLSAAAGAGAGAALAGRDHGHYDSHDQSRNLSMDESKIALADDKYEQGINHDFGPMRDSYMSGQTVPTPPMAKDEGYISGPNPRSPGAASEESRFRDHGRHNDDDMNHMDGLMDNDDPFVGKTHARHLSGNSHGMPSPLYDSATGRGMDRIQSKDIVALMDHLTVRDAQRNARDTEILVTLVRSAAEMRNSFEDMKKFIAQQDDMLVDTGNKQHERTTQKIIGGPRPQPLGTPRAPRGSSADDDFTDDLPAKRRNVFKRALKGLSMRSSNDLGKIEDMLVQLLGEVEGLKASQDIRNGTVHARPESQDSYDNMRAVGTDGYEPEGQAGTGSTGNQSGYFSNPPSRQLSGMHSYEGRRGSQNRVSTVLEGDEDLDTHEQNVLNHQFEQNEQLLTPTREFPRGGSVPLDTPPQVHIPTGAQSNEHTPKTGTDKSRKHKSSSSSFLPKFSRWSKTTASSAGDNFRNSGRRERPFSEASRSGSDLNYNAHDTYDPQGDDRLRSNDSVAAEAVNHQEPRPLSPLIPSQVSEGPKYQAHRNSLNLQHPQPRPGPTHRYQTHLESEAQNFGSPISPTSDQWGSNPSLARFAPNPANRSSGAAGNLSPISDAAYSETSTAQRSSGPARPPKIKDDGPLIPSRPPKITAQENKPTYVSRLSSERLGDEKRYSSGSAGYEQPNGSSRSTSGQVPQRKPTGPRPITSSGNYSPDKGGASKRNRYRDSPATVNSSAEDMKTF